MVELDKIFFTDGPIEKLEDFLKRDPSINEMIGRVYRFSGDYGAPLSANALYSTNDLMDRLGEKNFKDCSKSKLFFYISALEPLHTTIIEKSKINNKTMKNINEVIVALKINKNLAEKEGDSKELLILDFKIKFLEDWKKHIQAFLHDCENNNEFNV